jgi:hypothetical protein
VELDNDIMLKGKMLKPVLEILDKENEKWILVQEN